MNLWELITAKLYKWYKGHEGNSDAHHTKYTDAEAVSTVATDSDVIAVNEIKAKSNAGLKLHDDGGNGLMVKDGGVLHLTSANPNMEFKDTTHNRTGIMRWETKDYGDRYIYSIGDNGANPKFLIQKQSLIGTDDVIFCGYHDIANSNFIFEQFKGKHFYIQTRYPETGYGDILFKTGTNGTSNTHQRIRIYATNGRVSIGNITATALLDIDSDIVRLRTAKTPASATAAGNQGDICWDTNYIYICTASNTWKRAAIANW